MGSFWRPLAALTLGPLLAGCSALNLLEGKLPIGDEDDLGIVTRPYPGWESQAKATLDKIPKAEATQPSAAPASITSATTIPAAHAPATVTNTAETNVNTTVTQEQPAATNPAAQEAAAISQRPAKVVEAPPQLAQAADALAASTPVIQSQVASAFSGAAPALVHPTHEHPLAVTGAEGTPVSPPPAAGTKKIEPTPAQRLTALIKQRSEFLAALKEEVNRRRSSTDDDEELTRLEKELRLVQLAGEQPEEAVRQIEALDGPEREAFAHLLMGLATWMNADEARRPTLRNAKIVREIRDAAAELAAASKLDVRNLAFCEEVKSYGWFTEFSRSQFKSKQQVILYAEVENFAAIRIADDSFETELQGSYQIFDSRGSLMDERELPLDKEVCRNYRRDYFLAYLIYLPEGLSSGNYRLELTIEDKKGSAAHQEPAARRGEKDNKLVKTPSSASSYKGRKLGTGTIEFTVK